VGVGVLLWLLLAAAGALDAQARDDQTTRREVKKLIIRGVRSVDRDELKKSIDIEESHCKSMLLTPFCLVTKSKLVYEREYLTRAELARDLFRIQVFYWKRGWRQTTVDSTVTPNGRDGVTVTLTVNEGPPTLVTSIRVRRPEAVLSDKQVSLLLALRAGQPLNLLMLDSARVRIENALWDQGYADAIINMDSVTVSPDLLTSSVLIVVDPRYQSTVEEIRISGNQKIGDQTIRNSLFLSEGKLYRREDLTRSQRALYESGLFKRAQIIVPPQGDTTKIIEVSVTEAPLRQARLSAGFNTADFVQVEGRYANLNWSGGARRLNLSLAIGNLFASGLNDALIFRNTFENIQGDRSDFTKPTWRASAEVRQPWFLSPRNELSLGVFASRRSSPGIFIDRTTGASATFTRMVALRAPASLTYRFELNNVIAGDVYFCVNYGVCDLPTISALQREQRLSPLALTGSVDRTNDALNPSVGYIARLDMEHASSFTISDYRYNRAAADAAVYRKIGGNGMVLASHVRLGWVQALGSTREAVGLELGTGDGDVLHPRKRFYAGGAQSVRGYGEGQLGPRVLTIPPAKLTACTLTDGEAICPPDAINDPLLLDSDFTPRPVGGTRLLEGSVELRFPIWKNLGGAAFIDGALVGESSFSEITEATGAVTPGIGVRYYSPVGPIRVDLGFNPFIEDTLPVLTEVRPNNGGPGEIVAVQTADRIPVKRAFAPARNEGGFKGFLKQLTLHLSIGHAF
jgi:outer membrane protein insertion porin family/translocation and assembly module TamA